MREHGISDDQEEKGRAMDEQQVSEAFYLSSLVLFNKASEAGYDNLGAYPGVIEATVGSWHIRLNTEDEPVEGDAPFTVYLKYNGWPAGSVSADGGIMAAGAGANEVALIEALRRELPDE